MVFLLLVVERTKEQRLKYFYSGGSSSAPWYYKISGVIKFFVSIATVTSPGSRIIRPEENSMFIPVTSETGTC